MNTPYDAPQPPKSRGALSIFLAISLLLVACSKKEGAQPPGAAQTAPQLTVGVVTATPSAVSLVTELPGRIEASRTAQVRARAAGILQKRLFTEGSDIRAGQALFQIDAAPYEAAVQSAKANLARAQAQLQQTSSQLERYRPLVEANAISKQDFANAQAAQLQAQADVNAAQANVRTAQINLGHSTVTAPISGRIGRALVTEGALVGQGEATPLATIQQINPVYVNFTQSASEAFKLRKAMQEGTMQMLDSKDAQVQVLLDDGSPYELPGKLLFSDLAVDASTGQVTLRAEVPNPNGLLLPGLYVRIRLEQAQAVNAIALPQQAVTRTEQGDTVQVVGENGKVTQRPVRVTLAHNNQWLVQEGLQAGEQVMVDGFQKLQMMPAGVPVKTTPWTPAPPAGSPAAAASAKPSASPEQAQ